MPCPGRVDVLEQFGSVPAFLETPALHGPAFLTSSVTSETRLVVGHIDRWRAGALRRIGKPVLKSRNRLSIVGTVLLGAGFVLTVLAGRAFAEGTPGDPDIGTPALFLAGEVIGAAGLVLIVLALIRSDRAHRQE